MDEDERAIRNLVDRWMEASRAGDTAAVLDMMTDDVLFTVCGREAFGKEEFRAASEAMKGVRIDGRAEIMELEVFGDRGWIRNRIEMVMTLAGGEPVRRSGTTLTILKKEDDGRWRLFRDANFVT